MWIFSGFYLWVVDETFQDATMGSGNLWQAFITSLSEPYSGLYLRLIILFQHSFKDNSVLCRPTKLNLEVTLLPPMLSNLVVHLLSAHRYSVLPLEHWSACDFGIQCVSISLGVNIGPHTDTETGVLQGPLNMRSVCLPVSGQGIGTWCASTLWL